MEVIRRAAVLGGLVPVLVLVALFSQDLFGGQKQTAMPTSQPSSTSTPQLTSQPARSALVFVGSEVGREIPLGAPPGIYLLDVDTNHPELIGQAFYLGDLQRKPTADLPYGADRGTLKWSPDGTKVAFVSECFNETAIPDLYVINSDGRQLINVSNDPAPDAILCSLEPVIGGFDWSPDSQRLVFWSLRKPSGLYIVNADGSGLRYLTDGQRPVWSPSGDSIVFSSDPRCDPYKWAAPIYTIDAKGNNRRVLATVSCANSGLDGWIVPDLHWSPDGTLLAFSAISQQPDFSQPVWEQQLHSAVFIVKADGTGLRRVTGGDSITNWINCQRFLPTAGCELEVRGTNVQLRPLSSIPHVRIPYGEYPEVNRPVIDTLVPGDTVCLLGSPALVDGAQWWPVRTVAGREGWIAAFAPRAADPPLLTATRHMCRGKE